MEGIKEMKTKVKDMMKVLIIIMIAMSTFALVAILGTTPKTLVIDGNNNIAYAEAINKIYNSGLSRVSNETARLANAYIDDRDPDQIVLLDPTPQNVKDFSELANYHGARLIIGSTTNEVDLKSKMFELGLDNKKVQFQTNQDWDPDSYENIGKSYTY